MKKRPEKKVARRDAICFERNVAYKVISRLGHWFTILFVAYFSSFSFVLSRPNRCRSQIYIITTFAAILFERVLLWSAGKDARSTSFSFTLCWNCILTHLWKRPKFLGCDDRSWHTRRVNGRSWSSRTSDSCGGKSWLHLEKKVNVAYLVVDRL